MFEDLGYLPRVAFNLDFLFRRAGAHGKQALTMAMGFGCNAAGVIATRDHRLATRAARRDPHEQLRAVQRPLPDADHARHDLRRRVVRAGVCLDRRRRRRRRRRGARHLLHAVDVVAAVAHHPAGRSVGVHARIAAVPASQHRPHHLHVADRPHAVRAVAGDVDGGAGRRRDLAARQHPLGRPDAGRDHVPAGSIRSVAPSAWTASSCSPTSSPSRPTRSSCRRS